MILSSLRQQEWADTKFGEWYGFTGQGIFHVAVEELRWW